MFDDILGPRKEDLKPYLGEKKAEASVGGVDSPEGMEPKKPQGITGLKGRPMPTTPLIDDDDCECEDDCGDDCGCMGVGCLEDESDEDVWSLNNINAPHIG
jgi:hypothetical protein